MAQKQVRYNEAIVRKYPEQVVIAIAKDEKGMPNPITLGWTMITSGTPPMLAISVGLGRYSLGAIRHSKEFVISFPSEELADAALFFGSHSGRDMDKMKEHPVATQPAAAIDSVLLADAVANFECKLVSELETGDHVIFVGEVVAAHVNEEAKRRVYTTGTGHKLRAVVPAD